MQGASGCPFASGAAARAADKPAATSGCPFASSSRHADADAGASNAVASSSGAVCPLGFGTARGPKLSSLHCPVCKALLFDAHRVSSCRHIFCKSCISQTRDCPSCGRDVDGLEPDPETAGLVDTFLSTHSQSPQLVAAQADLGPLPDNSPASFFMAQGLKSLIGGNTHAALHRLGQAKQALLDAPLAPHTPAGASAPDAAADAAAPDAAADAAAPATDAAAADSIAAASTQEQHTQQHEQQVAAAAADVPSSSAVAKAVQLATVCGCLGDCYQRLADSEQARKLYSESVAAVQAYAEEHAEAAHAMSVSLNKLGDASYLSQQLPAAKALYTQALQLRQLCCGPLSRGQAGPQEQLELAASCVKLADVCKAMGEAAEAEQHLRLAQGVCGEVQVLESAGSLAPHVSRKLQLLLGVLQAAGQHVGGEGAGVSPAAAAARGP